MKMTKENIEIFFSDLTDAAQKEFLKAAGLKSASEGNYDIFPIAVIPREEA